MKTFLILMIFVSECMYSDAQDIPDVKLTAADGQHFDARQLNTAAGKPVVLAFWATWCIPCLNELSVINDNLEAWKAKASFDFYAISEDDSRTAKKVWPLVHGKNWGFPVLADKNQDLKRELNLGTVPYTIVVKNGKIIYRHSGYTPGDENLLYKIITDNQ